MNKLQYQGYSNNVHKITYVRAWGQLILLIPTGRLIILHASAKTCNYYCNVRKVRVFHQKNLIRDIYLWYRLEGENGRALMLDSWWEQMTKTVSVTAVCCVFLSYSMISYLVHSVLRMKWDSLDNGHCSKLGRMITTKICAGPGGPPRHREVRCKWGLEARGCEHDANTLLDPPHMRFKWRYLLLASKDSKILSWWLYCFFTYYFKQCYVQ